MQITLSALRPAAAILVAAATVLSLPSSAAAGCLREFGDCGDCAEAALGRAFWSLDLGGVADAWVDGIDCDLDLMHCILWGQHHDYDCGI
jgi:hypothetical protein